MLKVLGIALATFLLVRSSVSAGQSAQFVDNESAIATAANSSVVITDDIYSSQYEDDTGGLPGDVSSSVDRQSAGPQAVCSGYVAYSQGTNEIVVTARHCLVHDVVTFMGIPLGLVEGYPKFVTFLDGDIGTVQALNTSVIRDVMILSVHTKRHHPAVQTVATYPKTGQPLFTFGMPTGIRRAFLPMSSASGSRPVSLDWTKADQQGLEDEGIGHAMDTGILFSCAGCAPGTSGGPIFDNNGNVVAIVNLGEGGLVIGTPGIEINHILEYYGDQHLSTQPYHYDHHTGRVFDPSE
jgi:hypothetical protein